MDVQDPLLKRPGLQIGEADEEGDLVLGVEIVPQLGGKGVDVAPDGHPLRLTLERGDGVAVGDVGVQEMADAGQRGILKGLADAAGPLGIRGLQNGELVASVGAQEAGDAGRPVGTVRLKFPAS